MELSTDEAESQVNLFRSSKANRSLASFRMRITPGFIQDACGEFNYAPGQETGKFLLTDVYMYI